MRRRELLVVVGAATGGCLRLSSTPDGETECEERTIADEVVILDTDRYKEYTLNAGEGDEITVRAVKVGEGIDPEVRILDENRDIITSAGPEDPLERTAPAGYEGRYIVRVVNENQFESSQWDVTITVRPDC